MRAGPQRAVRKEGGEFNMAETSICVGSIDCVYERRLKEARPNWTTGMSSGDKLKD